MTRHDMAITRFPKMNDAAEKYVQKVWGCVLIGGRSSRMGRAKQLLTDAAGKTWLERIVSVLLTRVPDVVLVGTGEVPAALQDLRVIGDAEGAAGPLAGLAAVMRYKADVSWLLTACDMPLVSAEAMDWLLRQRAPEVTAVVPYNSDTLRHEPLFSWYDGQCAPYVETLLKSAEQRISRLIDCPGAVSPPIPSHLLSAWRNINTPEQLEQSNIW